jgi:hypothetical protein
MVNTSSIIDAYLASPNGTISLPKSFTINGGLMMKKMGKNFFKLGKGIKKLNWKKQYDVTTEEVIKKGYSTIINENWEYWVQ